MRTQLNVRIPDTTKSQIDQLTALGYESQAHIVIAAIDRLFQQEKTMTALLPESIVDLVLEGEFSQEFASKKAKAARAAHIVTRIGTANSTSTIHRMMESAPDTPGLWDWKDGRYTIVSIRERGA